MVDENVKQINDVMLLENAMTSIRESDEWIKLLTQAVANLFKLWVDTAIETKELICKKQSDDEHDKMRKYISEQFVSKTGFVLPTRLLELFLADGWRIAGDVLEESILSR